ncbi:MAG: peptide-methionine (S)-S-oxide reductase MsrA [Deltaproteobacteria bacterium]|nr:peptide-methionine (S)-S-oxide reductase MsrA [Deltaproteobacteria bacterium]
MFFDFLQKKASMPSAEEILPHREQVIVVSDKHAVLPSTTKGPWPGMQTVLFGLGCFWGAERLFWQLDGVVSTQVGYAAGTTKNPTYRDVCSGRSGHNEIVRVVWDEKRISFSTLLAVFFEAHDPTQGFRQGNDSGTQYRSGIYTTTEVQQEEANAARAVYEKELEAQELGPVTTEVLPGIEFFFAEEEHQQYLHKNPAGYCGLKGTGVSCALPSTSEALPLRNASAKKEESTSS